ncbi:MAG: prolipoprotein diacylglyceryl transferase [Candidatus Zixiibacteriota bacterium]
MFPELFHISSLPIRSYGLMLAISFFLGVLYIRYQAEKYNKPFEQLLTIAYIMIFGGVIGARLFYILFHIDEFSGNWLNSFNPFAGGEFGIAGLNLYGGFVIAIIGTFIYCRIKDISILEIFDFFSPTIGIGLAFTRIGCFLNGCCFGTPTDLPWGVTFPVGSIPYYSYGGTFPHLHPAQIYSSLYGVLLFILLHLMMKRKKFTGQLVAILFIVEAAFRYAIEYVRYYEDAMYFSIWDMKPTYNQAMSISLFIIGVLIYYFQMKKNTLNDTLEDKL